LLLFILKINVAFVEKAFLAMPLYPEVLNVKKSLIKIAQNMLNFGRRIKIF
jgi:hypothetical protein